MCKLDLIGLTFGLSFILLGCTAKPNALDITPTNTATVIVTPPIVAATALPQQIPEASIVIDVPLSPSPTTPIVEEPMESTVPPTITTDFQEDTAFPINDAIREEKKLLAKTLQDLNSMTPNVDYVENQVYAMVDSEAHAQAIADQYGMTMLQYRNSVATYSSAQTVIEIIGLAADLSNEMYPVYPDFIYSISAQ